MAETNIVPVKQVVMQEMNQQLLGVVFYCPLRQIKVFLAVISHYFIFNVFIRKRSRFSCCNKNT